MRSVHRHQCPSSRGDRAKAGRQRGFTVTELLTAVTVFGILSAVSLPSFREVTLNNQRAARVNELLTDLNFARTQAVSTDRQIVVCRTATPDAPQCANGQGWEDGWIVFVDAGVVTNQDYDAGEEVLIRRQALIPESQRSSAASEKFTLRGDSEDQTGTAARVVFAPSGTSPTTGSIVACDARNDPHKGRQILIVPGGRIRSAEPEANAGCMR